ncbi:unnamed protein product [Mytilus edulis]|uniref:SRCR domain-containing protein n=1 Tax=Mytilus edulis TaxID=6550 RepID=A0A8S3U088_MYTED|nr:unnamed protein product [Mytilus edulis]
MGTVCDDRFNVNAAMVVCRQLGFPWKKAKVITTHSLTDYQGPIYLDDLVCTGSEDNLLKCRMGTISKNNCSHEQDVSIKCQSYSIQGGSFFIGLPARNWTTSSHVCSLPGIEKINSTVIFDDNSLAFSIFEEVEKIWTGTILRYTKWAAFIGCGSGFSPVDSGRNVKTMEDCLRHCSGYSYASYFVLKSSKCFCISERPEINGDINDCRIECNNAIYTPVVPVDSKIKKSNTYIEKECLTTKDKVSFTVNDCNEEHLYGCKNTSYVFKAKSWYEYQEQCLKEGSFVLHNRNTIAGSATTNQFFWTPIFRTHSEVIGN